jgi:hypothetical protein
VLRWVFWSFRRLLRDARPARYLVPAALSLVALAIAHNIILVFGPLPLVVYLLVQWRQQCSMRRLAWALAAVLIAVGASAFFWLPVPIEQRFFLDRISEIGSGSLLALHSWTWSNFLDWSPVFKNTFATPFKLGLMQVVLALAGFVLAFRRDAEWLFWGWLSCRACSSAPGRCPFGTATAC